MWQRIQTLFLFLAIVFNAFLFSLDLAVLYFAEVAHPFKLGGLVDSTTGETIYSSVSLQVITLLSILLSAIVIFMFKKRQVQIKLSQLNLFIQVLLVAAIFFLVDEGPSALGQNEEIQVDYAAGTFLSLVPMVFIYLAIRKIKKDEALVRAADRIR